MNEVFVDTSGWAAAFVDTEKHHRKAAQYIKQWQQELRRLVTTNYVVNELVSLLTSRKTPRPIILQHLTILYSDPLLEIVHIDKTTDEKGRQLLRERVDKQWTLVDAVSFVVMQERGITEVLTEDKHFEQAGFIRLLR